MPSTSHCVTQSVQMDMFAEFEAEQRKIRTTYAPSLFDLDQRGFFARIAAAAQWMQEYDQHDGYRRSHAWHGSILLHDPEPTPACRPAILSADLRCDHFNEDCQCVGDLLYRAACLHCTWEGPARGCENEASEDGQDHAWPGWRDIPIVPRRPELGSGKREKDALAAWVRRVNGVYPWSWLETGGPIRTRRHSRGTRHVPHATGFGGWDMSGEVTA